MNCPDCKIPMLFCKNMSDGTPLAVEDSYYQCPRCKLEIPAIDIIEDEASKY